MTLDEFRELVKAGTKGPWLTDATDPPSKGAVYFHGTNDPSQLSLMAMCWHREVADAALIAAMRGHIDLFLELWEAAEKTYIYISCHPQCPAFMTPQMNHKCQCNPLKPVLAKLQGEKGTDG